MDQKYLSASTTTVSPSIPLRCRRKDQEDAPARYLFVDINTIDQRLGEAEDAQRAFWCSGSRARHRPADRGHLCSTSTVNARGSRTSRATGCSGDLDTHEFRPGRRVARKQTHRWRNGPQISAISAPPAATPGDRLPVVIRWQAGIDVIDRPLKARVALYNADGGRLAQDDRRVLNDRHLAPAQWTGEDRPLNVYSLALPTALPPGDYALKVLVYDADTLEPLEVLDAAGNGAGIEVDIGVVGITE
ncbi:MAG: hypothetical protein R2856_11980 [Caldilineaceae bacterium]